MDYYTSNSLCNLLNNVIFVLFNHKYLGLKFIKYMLKLLKWSAH